MTADVNNTDTEELEIQELDNVMKNLLSKLDRRSASQQKDNAMLKEILQEMDDLQQKIYQRMDELSK